MKSNELIKIPISCAASGGVPRQERHRIGFTMQFLRAPRIALSAHDFDGHVSTRQLLAIEEHVGETTLPQGTNPPESRKVSLPATKSTHKKMAK